MQIRTKILLVDDNEEDRFLWEQTFLQFGFEIYTAGGGREAIATIDQINPDVLLLDLNMPEMNGHEVCRHLRLMPKYANLPIIILTSSDDIRDKVDSFDEGADEYITKEMDRQEIEKRLTSIIRRYRQNLDSNPLTHLPGNNVIQHEIQRRISANETFAACYCDLDNFKAYNDAYGFVEGDQIIRFCAETIKKSLKLYGNNNDFLGHIGGDDFIFLSTPDKAETICNHIFSLMDKGISGFYTEEDRNRGFIISKNRQGEEQQFPLISISIAVVSNDLRPISSLAEVSKIASELKKVAKNKLGNSYAFDQRIQ